MWIVKMVQGENFLVFLNHAALSASTLGALFFSTLRRASFSGGIGSKQRQLFQVAGQGLCADWSRAQNTG
jgi:hypothetical protein